MKVTKSARSCVWRGSGDDFWERCLLELPGLMVPPSSVMCPGCAARQSDRDLNFLHFWVLENDAWINWEMCSEMVPRLHIKSWKIRLGPVLLIAKITLIFEGFAFCFIMLSGRVMSPKIWWKHCRVSQNRGSTVFHEIYKLSEKVLKTTPRIGSKVKENPKYPHRGPSENTPNF